MKKQKSERQARNEAVCGLIAMLLQLIMGWQGRNQRKWRDDWNRQADTLEGFVPRFPRKLVR